jgi:hypothetical protein
MNSVSLKIVGHELVTINVRVKKGTVEERQRLKVRFRGVDGDRKTTMVLMTDPKLIGDYPLGEVATLAFEITQQRMNLGPLPAGVS